MSWFRCLYVEPFGHRVCDRDIYWTSLVAFAFLSNAEQDQKYAYDIVVTKSQVCISWSAPGVSGFFFSYDTSNLLIVEVSSAGFVIYSLFNVSWVQSRYMIALILLSSFFPLNILLTIIFSGQQAVLVNCMAVLTK